MARGGPAVQLHRMIVAQDCLTTPVLRARTLGVLVPRGWAISHWSAAWVHWHVGSALPLHVAGPQRRLADDELVPHQRSIEGTVDANLPGAVQSRSQTFVDLAQLGALEELLDSGVVSVRSACATTSGRAG